MFDNLTSLPEENPWQTTSTKYFHDSQNLVLEISEINGNLNEMFGSTTEVQMIEPLKWDMKS